MMDVDLESEAGSSASPSALFVGGLDLIIAAVWEAMAPDLGFGPQGTSEDPL